MGPDQKEFTAECAEIAEKAGEEVVRKLCVLSDLRG